MPLATLREFFKFEAAGGIVLIAASALALILANTPLESLYDDLLETPLQIRVGTLDIAKPLLLWINDGLMAVFFFLVGLEIKREFLEGELSSRAQLTLPVIAAFGGMAVPALIFVLVNLGTPENLDGWAIPAATDIAFALGILALLGSKAPLSLKVLLTAVAIIDDLGAILIIAIFYSGDLSLMSLAVAVAAVTGLFMLNRMRIARYAPYMLIGIVLWVSVLKSGVHATLAGVILAFFIPMEGRDNAELTEDHQHSPLKHLEHTLHPWVAFGILPVFGFANAGVSFAGMTLASLFDPLALGIALGLFVGKQVGIFGAIWLTVKLGLSRMPEGANWQQLYGLALLCGIGFTMSLFIGGLAFDDPDHAAYVRLGVLSGSILAAIGGYVLIAFSPGRPAVVDSPGAPTPAAEKTEPPLTTRG
ncbi:MAG: Na+/H+ antiporter NhaA [Alphaproteobacteria bacterium]|nr:Na+/H+ antiporter NhaA [Alphaproteobacteria bacterium]